jgi:hypothetical protein
MISRSIAFLITCCLSRHPFLYSGVLMTGYISDNRKISSFSSSFFFFNSATHK